LENPVFDKLVFYFRDRDVVRRERKSLLLDQAKAGSVKALGQLAKLCKDSGDFASAIKYYKQIIDKGGRNAISASNNIGSIFYQQNKRQEAFHYFKYAADNGLTLAKKNIGILFEENEQYAEAISWYEIAAREGDTFAQERMKQLRNRPRPTYIHSWQAAEQMAQTWMFFFGYYDARVTQAGSDGGVDVVSSEAIAQVKFEQSRTGRPKLQELTGEAVTSGKKAFFFSLSGYTKNAVEWAESSPAGLALFQYDHEGMVSAVNSEAKAVLAATKKR
jgi:tetratricopeptide (TPR) repeat protein